MMSNSILFILTVIITISLLGAGCLDDEDERTPPPMTNQEITDFVADELNINPILLSQRIDRFGFEYFINGETWIINKHDSKEAFSISLQYKTGSEIISFERIQKGNIINIKNNTDWYYGRDEIPNYENPLSKLAVERLEISPEFNMTPNIGELNFTIDERNWDVKVEKIKEIFVHKAVSKKDSKIIKIIIQNKPLRILEYTVETNNNLELRYIYYYDDDIDIQISSEYQKTSFNMIYEQNITHNDTEDATTFFGNVIEEHKEEVKNSDVELRVLTKTEIKSGKKPLENETVLLSMLLTIETQNFTDSNGYYWKVTWIDDNSDGFVSAGDKFEVKTNNTSWYDYQIAFYDLWAGKYEGGPFLPGFGVISLIVIISVAAIISRRK